MTTIIVDVVNSLIGHQVTIVEEETIHAETKCQLQLVSHVPVILSIDTRTVELYTCGRLRLTTVTIGQTEDLRSSTVEEVIEAVIAIVTCTVTHVLVVGHLMLEHHAGSELVLTHIKGDVVLDVPDGVMNGIVIGKQLIAKGDVVVVAAIEDINEWELRRVGTTDIIELRIGCQELVGEVLRKAAVQIDRERVYDVLHRVHSVSVRHRILRHTCTAHTGTTVHRGGVRRIPYIVLGIVVAQSQMVLVGNVPVETSQNLVVALVSGEVCPGTSIVAILTAHVVRNGLKVREFRT